MNAGDFITLAYLWLVSGVAAYGVILADLEAARGGCVWHSTGRDVQALAAVWALLGPIGICLAVLATRGAPHGMRWTPGPNRR